MNTLLITVLVFSGACLADDACPAPAPCVCRYDIDEVTGKTIYVIDCNEKMLESVPDFREYSGKMIDKLLLVKNIIENISRTDFIALKNRVKLLDLSCNRLRENCIHPEAFYPLRESLIHLNLDQNIFRITNTTLWDFLSTLTNLTDLNASGFYKFGNQILPRNAFQNVPSLKNLAICRSRLTSLDTESFEGLLNIEKISLNTNSLTEVPVLSLRGLRTLKELDLEANDIHFIPARAFETLDNLETLNLNSLKLHQIDAIHKDAFLGIGDSLKRLSIRRSDLETFPIQSFAPFQSLTELDISENYINAFPPLSFAHLHRLKTLKISENPLNFTQNNMFMGLERSLEAIFIRRISGISNSLPLGPLKTLAKLKWVDASENRWTRLTKEVLSGLDIQRLTLQYMDINYVSQDAFDDMKTYRGSLIVELNENNIRDVNWLDSVILQRVDLRNNPIHCTCHLYRELSRGKARMSVDGKCASPALYKGMLLSENFITNVEENCGPLPQDVCKMNTTGVNSGQKPAYHISLAVAFILYALHVGNQP